MEEGDIRAQVVFSTISAVLKPLILTDSRHILTALRSLCGIGAGPGAGKQCCAGCPEVTVPALSSGSLSIVA